MSYGDRHRGRDARCSSGPGAQEYPHKPIRLVTELAAGTGGDVNLRRLLPHAYAVLGQPLVLDNRAGAGGIVAAALLTRAAPAR